MAGSAVVVTLENKLSSVGYSLAQLTGWEPLGSLGESVSTITGLIFIVCVLLFRRGIVGECLARIKGLQ